MCRWLVGHMKWRLREDSGVSQFDYLSRTILQKLSPYKTSVMRSLHHRTALQTWESQDTNFAVRWKFGNTKSCKNLTRGTTHENRFSPFREGHPTWFYVWVHVCHLCKRLLLWMSTGKGKDIEGYRDNAASLEGALARYFSLQHGCRIDLYSLEKRSHHGRQKLASAFPSFPVFIDQAVEPQR